MRPCHSGLLMSKSPKIVVGDIAKDVNRKLHTRGGRDFITYLICFCVAFFFWCILTLDDTAEHDYEVRVELTNVPDSVILVGDMPSSLNVVVRGKGTQFVRYYFMKVPTMQIDFRQYSRSGSGVSLSRMKLDSRLRDIFGQGVSVVSVNPDSIRVPFTSSKGIRMPLKVNARVKAASSSVISGPITSALDSVTIYTVNGQHPDIDHVETELLSCTELTDTLVYELAIKKIPGARVIPDKVTVTVPVELLASRKATLPIKAVNVPENCSVITYPATVDVSYLVPLRLSGQEIPAQATVDYSAITSGSRMAHVEVKVAPGVFRIVSVSRDSVEYVIDR